MRMTQRGIFTLGMATLLIFAFTFSVDLPAQTKSSKAEPVKKIKGRLPNNFGKLGLSTKQRTTIYEIQAKYRTKLADLQKQIDDLKAEQGEMIEGVLTADQKKKLQTLLDAKKKKS